METLFVRHTVFEIFVFEKYPFTWNRG